jgi:hypothetical protein
MRSLLAIGGQLSAISWICALSLALALSGCEQDDSAPVIAPQPASQTAQLSGARAAVDQLRRDNAKNPDGPAKQAVDLQAGVAQAALPEAKPADAAKAAELSALVFAGRLEEALKRAMVAESEAAQLRAQSQAELAASEARISQIIAEARAQVSAAQAKAQRSALLLVVGIFAVIGGAITLAGIVCAVTGWSRIGILGIPAGILIGGSGLLWGRPWFVYSVGAGVLLTAVAFGIFWAVKVHDARAAKSSSSTPPAA